MNGEIQARTSFHGPVMNFRLNRKLGIGFRMATPEHRMTEIGLNWRF